MKFIAAISLTTLLASFSTCLAQSKDAIQRLLDADAAKTISLNPEYYVHGLTLVKGDEKLPLLIVLHGGGGTGLKIGKSKHGAQNIIRSIAKTDIKTLVVAPQASKSPRDEGAKGGWVPADLDVLLAHLIKTLPVDPQRVYLTGSSMGGYGTYAWAASKPEHFAAIAPMVGGLGALGPTDITPDLESWGKALSKLPMRAYYGADDRVVPADRGEMISKAIKAAGGGKQSEVIVLKGIGHNAGQTPYSDPDFFRWLFSNRKATYTSEK